MLSTACGAVQQLAGLGIGGCDRILLSCPSREQCPSREECGAAALKMTEPAETFAWLVREFERLGQRLLAGEDGSAGGGMKPKPDHFDLLPRELEVLRALASGLGSNKAIARHLNERGRQISAATVKLHLTRAMAKIGVSDRTQAALLAQRWGWFTASSHSQ